MDVWLGGAGSWTDPTKWSLGVVPNNGNDVNNVSTTFTAEISNGQNTSAAVTIPSGTGITIDNLSIDATNSLTIANGGTLAVVSNAGGGSTTGTIDNAGTIALDATNLGTTLDVSGAGTVTLSGGGMVTMSNSIQNLITGGGATLTNVDNTIQGAGQINDGLTDLVNQAMGTIDANQSGGLLQITVATLNNTGTVEATGSGVLQMQQIVNNASANATIQAAGVGSTVILGLPGAGSVTINGGTLTTQSGGAITASGTGGGVTLNGLTISTGSTFTVADGQTATLGGTITNEGTIALDGVSPSLNTTLNISGPVTLTGGGTVTMTNFIRNYIVKGYNPQNLGSLTNVDNTIEGSGQIANLDQLVNEGTIRANQPTALSIHSATGGMIVTNTSTIEATGGGSLVMAGLTNNSGGTILATGAGSAIQLGNPGEFSETVNGGTLTTQNGGVISGSGLGGGAALNGVTISSGSTYTLLDGQSTTLKGTITNNGTIALDSTGDPTTLSISGPVTLPGGGMITMSSNSQNFITGGTTDTLTNAAGDTIQGAGQIAGLAQLINQGTIDANQSQGLEIHSNVATAVNTGTLEATGGASLLMAGLTTNTGGTILATGAGSAIQLGNPGEFSETVTGGTLETNTGGVITGSGVAGGATLSGVTINAGSTYTLLDGQSTTLQGTITNNGTIALNSTGDATTLAISGSVTLTGGGSVTLSNHFQNLITGGGATLTNVDNTIQGAGQINGLADLVNQATIDANQPSGLLQSTVATINNSGTIEATGGGALQMQQVVNDTSANATIEATGMGSTIILGVAGAGSVTVNGGTLTTGNGGIITSQPGTSGTLSGVTISTGSTVTVGDSQTILLQNTITNNGTIALNSTGDATTLTISGSVMLAGGGTVTTSNHPQNLITGGGATLTNVDNTIEGAGQINGLADLVNQAKGTIDANQSGGLLITVTTVDNSGTLEASGSGVLQRQQTVNNANGTILADGLGSMVILGLPGAGDATVNGGTLTTQNSGVITSQAGTSGTLNGVTISTGSTVTVGDGQTIYLQNTISNAGTIALNSTGHSTTLNISGAVTLTGGGAVTMSNNSQNLITSGGATLTNVNNTIQGAGQINDGLNDLVNQGTIDANQSGGVLLITVTTVDNSGTLEASGSGVLQRQQIVNNANGTILADGAGSTVVLGLPGAGDATVNGGTLTTQNNGVITSQAGTSGTLSGVTISSGSTVTVGSQETIFLQGAITNKGTLAISAVTSSANVQLSGNVSLSGGGSVTMSNNTSNFIIGAGNTLTNVDNTIQGAGQVVNLAKLVNNGLILANQPTALVIQSNVTTTDNTGTLEATAGAVLALSATATNEGTVQVDANSTIGVQNYTQNSGLTTVAAGGTFGTNSTYNQAGGTTTINTGGSLTAPAFSQTAGITTVDGTLTASSVNIAGTLFGNGTVTGTVSNTGIVIPGDSPTPGQLLVGAYAQNSGGALDIALGGTTPGVGGFDVLNISTVAALNSGSILNVSLANGFTPTDNETFQFMNYGSETGTFTTLNGLQQGNVTFTVDYLPTFALLTAHVTVPPTATTQAATSVTGTAATLNGSVNPEGLATTVTFVYGTDPTLMTGTTTTAAQAIGSGTSAVPVTAPLTGLQPGTKYYDEVVATGTGGTIDGSILSFTTLVPPSGTTTQAATNVTGTAATLNGSANPAGNATTVTFVYGTDPSLTTGTTTTAAQAIGSGTSAVPLTAHLTGLQPGTKYYDEVVATSVGGTSTGSIGSFTTMVLPTATTQPATAVTGTAATLNGSVNPEGADTSVVFVYGTDSTLTSGTTTTTAQDAGSGSSAAAVNVNLTNLTPGTTYYDRVIATSTAGTTDGTILSFNTLQLPPAATTQAATDVTTTSATLNGSVNPQGSATTVSFVFGTDSTLTSGTMTTTSAAVGSGTSAVPATGALSGLNPGTTYYYEVVATSTAGTSAGAILSFTTATPAATVPTATTQPATAITGTTATLNGSVNPDGSPTTVTFVFGTSSTLASGTTTTTTSAIGSGTSAAPVTGSVSGLTPGTTYYYEVLATNTVGTSAGAILGFSTLPAPASATGAATNVTTTAATLGASVNPAGSATTVSFIYGTDPSLTSGTTTTAAQSIGSGTSAVAVAANLTGLQPATTYYIRVVATNAAGTTQGAILSFTTAPATPPTSPVTVTGLTVTKVKVGTGHHAQKALVLDVHFSGSLSSSAAQELAAYTVYSGKIKKVHKVSQAIYTSFVPLTQAIYVPSADSVLLLPQGKHKLPKLEQLHVNVSLLTDPMGRSINNGKNFTATTTNTGFVLSAASTTATEKPAAAVVDALFEQGLVSSVPGARKPLPGPGSDNLP
jgi:phosphodiesterase/alkaline phosphatase D-like protein